MAASERANPPSRAIRVHRKTQAYIVCPPKGCAGGRSTQLSTFPWTVAGYHPITCRGLADSTGGCQVIK